jgi:hypothetical protein
MSRTGNDAGDIPNKGMCALPLPSIPRHSGDLGDVPPLGNQGVTLAIVLISSSLLNGGVMLGPCRDGCRQVGYVRQEWQSAGSAA